MRFDRPNVDDSDVPEIAAMYFSVEDVVGFARLDGIPNVSFSIDRRSSSDVVIRVCNNGYTSVAHLDAEVEALRHLAAIGFEFSPRPVLSISGRFVENWGNYRVICTERIVGQAGLPGVRASPEFCTDLGRVTARLIVALQSAPVRLPQDESFVSRTRRLLGVLPDCVDRLGWAECQANTVCDITKGAFARLSDRSGRDQLIHTDLWPPNVLWRSRDRVGGVVDFDDMAFGPPALDFAATVSEFCILAHGSTLVWDVELLAAFVRGFCAVRTLSDGEISMVPDLMLACSASWFACNAFNGASYDESAVYLTRLHSLSDSRTRARLASSLHSAVAVSQ